MSTNEEQQSMKIKENGDIDKEDLPMMFKRRETRRAKRRMSDKGFIQRREGSTPSTNERRIRRD
jgi:hypothetical protein